MGIKERSINRVARMFIVPQARRRTKKAHLIAHSKPRGNKVRSNLAWTIRQVRHAQGKGF